MSPPDELAADGVPDNVLEKIGKIFLVWMAQLRLSIEHRYLPVADMKDPKNAELKAPAHRLRSQING